MELACSEIIGSLKVAKVFGPATLKVVAVDCSFHALYYLVVNLKTITRFYSINIVGVNN